MLKNPSKFEKYHNLVNSGLAKDAPITPVIERMMADQQKRMAQKQEVEMRQQREQETLEEMALPSPSGKAKGTRSIKKFMNDQERFEERRSQKLEELKQQEQSGYHSMFKYTASNKSKMILEKKKKNEEEQQEEEADAFERLHYSKETTAAQEQNRIMKPVTRADFEYQPQINEKSKKISREVNIVELLGHDAERRQKRKADAEGVKAHVEQSQM